LRISTASDEESIRKLLEAQAAAWNAGDVEGWCKDFTSDSTLVNILGIRFDGRDNNARRHGELFAGFFKDSRNEIVELKIRLLGDSAAIADAVLDLKHFRNCQPTLHWKRRAHYQDAPRAGP